MRKIVSSYTKFAQEYTITSQSRQGFTLPKILISYRRDGFSRDQLAEIFIPH
jgi:hypothetical protein